MKKIVLASKSPRRQELMSLLPFEFTVDTGDTNEVMRSYLSPSDNAKNLARQKAKERAEFHPDAIIIGCDTIVACGEEIFGKPKDERDAAIMLKKLSAKDHYVYTGVCILDGRQEISFVEATKVKFRRLTDEEIFNYVKSGEPMDKAGAYGIQGKAAIFISGIEGDYYSVVGLPVCRLTEELTKLMK